jgi:outer membrane protein assembly factor BamB
VDAGGVYSITPLSTAGTFDEEVSFIESKLVALETRSGAVVWQRTFTRPFLFFSIAPERNLLLFSTDVEARNAVEAVDASSGEMRWSVPAAKSVSNESEKNAWPIILTERVVCFEDTIALRLLADGESIWERGDLAVEGLAQPEIDTGRICFQSPDGLVALDLDPGQTVWMCEDIKD